MSKNLKLKCLLLCALLVITAVGQTRPAFAAATITVNGSSTLQVIDGFGISGAFQRASIMHGLQGLSTTKQAQVIDLLFNTTSGAGFSILRNIIGSSTSNTFDLVKTILPTNPGGPSATPNYVWDGNDADQVWLSQQAKSYGVTQFYADVWSAPAFMKTNGSEANGGTICGVPGGTCASGDWRQAYANYLVKYIQLYQSVGINITHLGFTNEPDLSTAYASMTINNTQLTDLVKVIGATLNSSGLGSVKLVCCDNSNWDLAVASVNTIVNDATARGYLAVGSGHGYGGNTANPMTAAQNAGKHVWQTEWSTFDNWNASWDSGSGNTGYAWADRIHTALTSANMNGFLYWWGGFEKTNNEGLISISGDSYTVSKRFWAFASYSRYIRPGATRISASTSDSTLRVTAYKNSDGSVVIVVLNSASAANALTFNLQNLTTSNSATPYLTNNTSDMAQQAAITISGGSFTASVPARSLVTYRIAAGSTVPTNTPVGPTPTPTPIPSGDGSPYTGTAVSLPGTVQVENYNTGGQGVAYNDTTSGNSGNVYRTTENVDVEATTDTGTGYNVGWTVAGEWLKYTVNVQTNATYTLTFRVASAQAGGSFHLEVDGVNVTGAMTMPNTGGWQTWTSVTKTGVNFTAGQHVMRLVVDGSNGNFNWFSVGSGVVPTNTSIPPTSTNTPVGPTPTAASNLVQNGEFDNGTTSWVFNPTNGGAGSMAVVAGQGLSGTNALQVTITNGGTANWHVQVGQSGINIVSGRTYTVSFMAKAASNRTINVFLQQNGSPFTIYRSQDFNITTTANTYSFTWTSNVNDANTALRFNVGTSTITTYIDNVSVR